MPTADTQPVHGTATSWRRGCHCNRCRAGLRRAAKVWWATRRLRTGADPATVVAAKRTLAHVDNLAAAGMSARRVAVAAGVAPSTLTRARQTGRVSRIVERLVLAVEP